MAYDTAVSGLVIHLKEIHLNPSQIWGASKHDPNPNPKSCSKCGYVPRSYFSFLGVTCLVGVF